MRDYIQSQAEFQDQAFAFPRARRWLRSWMFKRHLRKLESLDNYLLNDIGLSRDDLRYGLKLPYDVDGLAVLDQIRQTRLGRGTRHR